ncbi:MAG TPA: AAA family ATPase [Phycisphaerales bacterium]
MILKTAHVTKYKCVKDSTEFTIDKDVTCLVGKNEAGKTTILEALSKLKPVRDEDGKFDVTRDYPRHELTDYQAEHEKRPATAITTKWLLEEDDLKAIEALVGPEARKIGDVSIAKNYANGVTMDFAFDEAAVIQHLLKTAEMNAQERMKLKGIASLRDLTKQLAAPAEDAQARASLAQSLKDRFGDNSAKQAVINLIWQRTPRFAYFSQYLRMPGQLAVDAFTQRTSNNQQTDEDRVFTSLLDMIGMSVAQFAAIKSFEDLSARLEATSNKLTKELVRYWSQNEYLKMNFRFDAAREGDAPPFNSGWILRTRIENTRHGATTGFDQRSSGFVWFFSFLVWFNQLKKNIADNLIILLDEPGLALHASAQGDLLRYIEERLAPSYQVVYTTHSPFMLDPANLLRARTVEDVYREVGDEENPDADPHRGTKVSDQVLRAERATLFPLRACLGYEITQSLFVGKHNLLVEGPSDLLYIDWFRRKLAAAGRTSLDPRWTVVPCGGVSKVSAFMSLFGGNGLHCAVLCDFADGGKNDVEKLRSSDLMRADHILTVDTYAGKPQADTEDLLGNAGYVALVNATYGLKGANAISATKADGSPIEGRVVKHVELVFPVPKSGEVDYNHTAPADWLVRQGIGYTLTDETAAMERFEKMFTDLNKLLEPGTNSFVPEVVTTIGRRAMGRR